MPEPSVPAPPADAPLALVCGDDEFAVKQRASRLYQQWCEAAGGLDHERIDAAALNGAEALKALSRLREALQTLPFFGNAKVIWFRDCSFLGEEAAVASKPVTEFLNQLAQELKTFNWSNVRLLISAGRVDKRRTFFRVAEQVGRVETVPGLSASDKDWATQAEQFVRQELAARKQEIDDEALAALVAAVGPNLRQLANEVEKVSLYAGNRPAIQSADVAAITSRAKQAQAFGLADALGDRDLPRALRRLDEDLWQMRSYREASAIGLLYGLISKVRTLLLLKEMLQLGWLKPTTDYQRFKAQLTRLPTASFPDDKRYNPQAMHPYLLFKAVPQTANYSSEELVAAMNVLLACNRQLVSSRLEEASLLQRALVAIIGRERGGKR